MACTISMITAESGNDERGCRATSYTARMKHSITKLMRATPWRAVQQPEPSP
jgi:hypothetical protein